MQPLRCSGGYALPIGKGKKEIYGVVATVSTTTSASRLALMDTDDYAIVSDTASKKKHIIDLKGLANADGVIGCMFPEPIKVNDGVSLDSNSTNLIAGRTFLYIR